MAGVFYFPLLGTPTAEGNQLWFYEAGLDQPLDVWTDSDLTIPWVQPIVFNATGNPDGLIYVSPSPAYKVVYKDADDVPIPGYPVDFVSPSTIPNVTTSSITVLTNAQIKALPTTPVELIAAPAAGTFIHVFAVTVVLDASAGIYTNLNATYAALDFTNLSALSIVKDTAASVTTLTDLLATADTSLVLTGAPYVSASATGGYVVNYASTSAYDGVAFAIRGDNNGSGNWTGGNAANTMTITVSYAIESLA